MTSKTQIYVQKEDILAHVENAERGKYYVAPNIFLEITPTGKANWRTRFKFKGKRYEKVIGAYGEDNPYFMSYGDAIEKSKDFQKSFAARENPLERPHAMIETVDELMTAFLAHTTYKYEKEQKVYEEIKPLLGEMRIKKVTSADLEKIIKRLVDSERISIAVIAVGLFKNLFDYASIHKLIKENVAAHLNKAKHAGQTNEVRKVRLRLSQIRKVFNVFQQYPTQARLAHQCAIALYIIFGFRKGELLSAKWQDFDEEEQELTVRPSKMGDEELTVRIPDAVLPLFSYLRSQANDSSFIFPTIRCSASGHLSLSTLNAMINTFFKAHKTRTVEINNPMGELNIPKFCVHDLRRTFTTIAADHRVADNVIELGLNHLKRKSIRPYDHSSRPQERGEMYELMAEVILPLTNLIPLVQEQLQENIAPSLPQAA
ncbi:MAG: integrase family protein [Pseudomonadota bacterium]|nr:integrase family protein [Pseudomonadota bacterium]